MGEALCPSLDAAIRETVVLGRRKAAPNTVVRSRSPTIRRPAAIVAACAGGMGTSSLF